MTKRTAKKIENDNTIVPAMHSRSSTKEIRRLMIGAMRSAFTLLRCKRSCEGSMAYTDAELVVDATDIMLDAMLAGLREHAGDHGDDLFDAVTGVQDVLQKIWADVHA